MCLLNACYVCHAYSLKTLHKMVLNGLLGSPAIAYSEEREELGYWQSIFASLTWSKITNESVSFVAQYYKVMLALIFIQLIRMLIKQCMKGRPTNHIKVPFLENATPETSETVRICSSDNRFGNSNGNIESIATLMRVRDKPTKFVDGMNITTWLKQLEDYLAPMDKAEWTKIGTTYIESSTFAKLIDTNFTDFNQFKKKMKNTFTYLPHEETNIATFCECKQGNNESIDQFSTRFMKLAEKTFVNIDLKVMTTQLCRQFVSALHNPRVRSKCDFKLRKATLATEKNATAPLTLTELLDYAQITEQNMTMEETITDPYAYSEQPFQVNVMQQQLSSNAAISHAMSRLNLSSTQPHESRIHYHTKYAPTYQNNPNYQNGRYTHQPQTEPRHFPQNSGYHYNANDEERRYQRQRCNSRWQSNGSNAPPRIRYYSENKHQGQQPQNNSQQGFLMDINKAQNQAMHTFGPTTPSTDYVITSTPYTSVPSPHQNFSPVLEQVKENENEPSTVLHGRPAPGINVAH